MDIITRKLSKRASEGLKARTMAQVDHIMKGIASDPVALLEVVAGGPYDFRLRLLRESRGLALNENIADMMFRFFCEKVVARWGPDADPGKILDKYEVKSPLTDDEIERSWVHEVFSTEDGRRMFYQDGAGIAGSDHRVVIH